MSEPDPRRARAAALHLHGLLAHWPEVAATDWVASLLAWEEQERHRRSLERRLSEARIGRFKPLCDFDWPCLNCSTTCAMRCVPSTAIGFRICCNKNRASPPLPCNPASGLWRPPAIPCRATILARKRKHPPSAARRGVLLCGERDIPAVHKLSGLDRGMADDLAPDIAGQHPVFLAYAAVPVRRSVHQTGHLPSRSAAEAAFRAPGLKRWRAALRVLALSVPSSVRAGSPGALAWPGFWLHSEICGLPSKTWNAASALTRWPANSAQTFCRSATAGRKPSRESQAAKSLAASLAATRSRPWIACSRVRRTAVGSMLGVPFAGGQAGSTAPPVAEKAAPVVTGASLIGWCPGELTCGS